MEHASDPRGVGGTEPPADRAEGARFEQALAALPYDRVARDELRAGRAADPRLCALDLEALDEAAAAVRRMIRARTHRGTGGLVQWYPRTLAAWRHAHREDSALDLLLDRFCASAACGAWREGEGGQLGISLEQALHDFFELEAIGEPAVREAELLSALVRSLAVCPSARFRWPSALRGAPGGCVAVSRAGVLHAAIDGRYLHGPVTPLVAALLAGDDAVASADAREVVAALRAQRLIA